MNVEGHIVDGGCNGEVLGGQFIRKNGVCGEVSVGECREKLLCPEIFTFE